MSQANKTKTYYALDIQLFVIFWISTIFWGIIIPSKTIFAVWEILWISLLSRYAIKERQKYQWKWRHGDACAIFIILAFGVVCANIAVYDLGQSGIKHDRFTSTNWLASTYKALEMGWSKVIDDSSPLLILVPFISAISGIFTACINFQAAYQHTKDFYADCENPPTVDQPTGLEAFSQNRYLDVVKADQLVTMQVHALPARRTNDLLPLAICGSIPALGITSGIINIVQNIDKQSTFWGWLCTGGIMIAIYGLWRKYIRIAFIQNTFQFKPNALIFQVQILGQTRKTYRIPRTELIPLQQQQTNPLLPDHQSLYMRYPQQRWLLAKFLFESEAAIIMDIYDRYRTHSFKDFYEDTEEQHMRLN